MPISMTRRCTMGAALSLLIGLTASSYAAEPSFPRGLSVGLVPPPDMTSSKSFAGFEHRSGASIVIVEMPAEAYPQIIAGFTPERFRPTGFIAKGEGEALSINGNEGRLLRGTQSANGLAYHKWVAVVKGQSGTGLVTVQVPENASNAVPAAAVETALRTIAFRTQSSVQEQIAALPFTIGEMAGFRPVRVLAGSSLILTKGPKDVDPDGTQPVVIVASSFGEAVIPKGQESALSRKAFGIMGGLKDIEVTDETKPTAGALRIVKLRGSAKHNKSDQPMRLTQVMLIADKNYIRVIGIAPTDASEAIPEAERIAASVAFR